MAWEFHVREGASLLLVSRLPPLVLALALAWFVVRRLGQSALQPAVLIALVAVSLSLRLLFEDNVFSYYYMALAVTLVVLDVVRGRIRETLVAWLAMVTLVYTEPSLIVWRQSWGQDARTLDTGNRDRGGTPADHSRRPATRRRMERCDVGRDGGDGTDHVAGIE